jgi:glycosyltransferase involved in cell wall biosynthesis
LADRPEEFAEKVVELLSAPEQAAAMAARARAEVEQHWDAAKLTGRLAEDYRDAIRRKRAARVSEPALV